MGFIMNHCIVLTGETETVSEIIVEVERIAKDTILSGLISNVINHPVNGQSTFFIAPDGSKEGWHESIEADNARADIISYVKKQKCVDWFEAAYGGDMGNAKIVDFDD